MLGHPVTRGGPDRTDPGPAVPLTATGGDPTAAHPTVAPVRLDRMARKHADFDADVNGRRPPPWVQTPPLDHGVAVENSHADVGGADADSLVRRGRSDMLAALRRART